MKFRKLDGAARPWLNRILARGRHWRFTLGGVAWQAGFVPAAPAAPAGALAFKAAVAGHEALLEVERGCAMLAVAHHIAGGVAPELPAPLLQALLEVTLAEVLGTVTLAACAQQELAAGYPYRLGLQIQGRPGTGRVEISTGLAGLQFLAEACDGLAQDGAAGQWDGLRLPWRALLGWTDLALPELRRLAPRDVIFLDRSLLHAGELDLQFGAACAWRAAISGATLTIKERLDPIMESDSPGGDLESGLDNLAIRLTFDLGEQRMTLGQLRALAPGYSFDLGRDRLRTVTIRANGARIGEGELVEIDGRIGVGVVAIEALVAPADAAGEGA